MTRAVIVLLSGGLDSTVLLADLLDAGHRVHAVGADYGQRHRRELDAADDVAAYYGVEYTRLDLRQVGSLLAGSALTDPSVPVPLGHYADASMRSTVVPNRNAILLSIAVGIASARGSDMVATAVHAGDHPVYPDCRPSFITVADMTARIGTQGHGDVRVVAPFVLRDKTWIARRGADLRAPLALTWSCYQGGDTHCGQCGTCVERREAFALACVADPTAYGLVST